MTKRAIYQAPKLEVQRLRELPSALASSGGKCHSSPNNAMSCSISGSKGKKK